jgi:two-component system, OmpR family, sensor histidine kinase KdpD
MNDDERPDPDRLLRRVEREEQLASRGKLKVFLGAVAGVGKTYAMLEQARLRRRQGVDVVVGWVETHGRSETDALLEGLERLAPRSLSYRGTDINEFDLDGALARRPTLLLLDELAHTNAPGSRHAKRWQDAEELLAAGIDVATTVNIQHLESLNDVITQSTGVVVRETVPDRLLDEADEVELVDLTPEDLLERLRDGKVYLPAQAERALRGFFTRGNLIALRELSLRRAAQRVDAELQTYKKDEAIGRVLPVAERLLVCVSPSPSAARVVRSAARMASGLRAEWIVAYVERPGDPRQTESDRERIDQTLRMAEQLGAETVALTGLRVADELLSYARSRNVTKIVIGKPARAWWRYRLFGSVVDELIRRSDDIDVYVIRGEASAEPARGIPRIRRRSPPRAYVAALVSLVVTIGLCFALNRHLAPSNLAMIFLLDVVFVAGMLGRGPSIVASLLAVAVFDFFFVPPAFTFAVSDGQYIVTFGVMLTVALIISTLTVRLRQQSDAHRRRQEQTAVLYRLTRELSESSSLHEVALSIERNLGALLGAEVWILIARPDGTLIPAPGTTSTFPLEAKERSVAEWVHGHGQMAGRGTNTLQGAGALWVPIRTARRKIGVLGLFPSHEPQPPPPDRPELLEVIAGQVATALERAL